MTLHTEIQTARNRIAAHIRTTPVLFDSELGIWLKWENQQVTGSFKPRGALNKILSLTQAQLDRGLVACSAGNHGQGVALAARIAGARATVYASAHAAQNKIDKMRALGAEVIQVAGGYMEAEVTAIRVAQEQNKTWVSPYNDPLVIAGQATVALEVFEQCPAATRWLVPVGGGGLIAGMIAGADQKAGVIGVQAAASTHLYEEYHHRDLALAVDGPTLADGLTGGVEPGSMTFELIHGAADVRLVTEDQIADAIRYAYRNHSQVIEGSGAVGLALVLSGQLTGDGQTMVLVSGGNIDEDKHRAIIKD